MVRLLGHRRLVIGIAGVAAVGVGILVFGGWARVGLVVAGAATLGLAHWGFVLMGRATEAPGLDQEARDRIERESPCAACGYSLRGLGTRGRCPECGATFEIDGGHAGSNRARSGSPAHPEGRQVLETERLRLREMALGDADAIEAIMTDEEVTRVWEQRFSREDCRTWIERQMARYRRDGCGYWLCTQRESREVIGQAGVLLIEVDGRREVSVGYILSGEHRGRGYATEAARACVRWAFANTDAERVIAPVRPGNEASIRVAERLGMREGWRTRYAGLPHVVYIVDR